MREAYRGHGIEWTGDLYILTDSDGDLMGEYDIKADAVEVADLYADEQEASDLQDAKDEAEETFQDMLEACDDLDAVNAIMAILHAYKAR